MSARWLLLLGVVAACHDDMVAAPLATASATAVATATASPSWANASATASATASAAPSSSASAAPAAMACRDLTAATAETTKHLPLYPDPRPQGVHVSTLAPWKKLSELGVSFAFMHASLGVGRSADFRVNWKMAKACGLPRGAYHFLSAKQDGGSQAQLFLDQLDGDLGELPFVIDAERPPGCASACCERDCKSWEQLIASWLAVVAKSSSRKPLVYTVRDWWKECLCNTSRFANHALWLGAYPDLVPSERPAFGGWQTWLFFHHRGNVRFGGGVIDLDLFRGSKQDLAELTAPAAK